MSEDNSNSDPFDIDFDALRSDNPSESTESSSFDMNNPFGDDLAIPSDEAGVSANNSYLDNASDADSAADVAEESVELGEGEEVPQTADNEKIGKKRGLLGGLLGGKKKKGDKKEKAPKEKKISLKKEKKEKVAKEKKPAGEAVPRDWGTILCIVFSVFLLVSLLMVNISSFLTAGGSMLQTLCFLGAFNLVGLVAAAVPILFYKFPKERTLPNVMLGIAAVATFTSVQMAVIEFYRYSFIMTP